MNARPTESTDEQAADALSSREYEPPVIEAVLTPEEMARETLYAGNVISGDDIAPG